MHQPQQLLDNISNPNFDIFDFCLNRMSSLSLQRFDRAIARILLEDINDPQVWRMTSTVKELFDVILHVMLYRFGERAREIAGDEPLEVQHVQQAADQLISNPQWRAQAQDFILVGLMEMDTTIPYDQELIDNLEEEMYLTDDDNEHEDDEMVDSDEDMLSADDDGDETDADDMDDNDEDN
ncbi:hypothetical protein BC940DRAFT_320350 [Gongronella butleri]|nr:hypothetical protein BC940DRAFT_320350 [Gongronella butleri]